MGKTILLFEGGKSKNLDQSVINCGVNGALNVMKYLGLQKGKIHLNNSSVVISRSKWIRSPFSGMFQYYIKNGSKVSKKTILGRITDPFGEFEKQILAPFDCYIYGINTAPIVNKGDALFHVSFETK